MFTDKGLKLVYLTVVKIDKKQINHLCSFKFCAQKIYFNKLQIRRYWKCRLFLSCLKKFTGHATPVTYLSFIPSSLSHDTNANHIPSNGISGNYFISGAEQDRLVNVW